MELNLSLTGKDSHLVNIPLGQGSFAIGAIGMDAKKFDVLVDHKLPINWDCFNACFTGSGQQNAHLHPYGDWPRFFYYWGNDANFIQWSTKRKIEDFTWCPNTALNANFSSSNINRLFIIAQEHPLKFNLGKHQLVSVSGNLDHIAIDNIGQIHSIAFSPDVQTSSKAAPYQLPIFEAFKDIHNIDIHVKPLGQAFDCSSLLQFSQLTHLNLSGNLANLDCLKKLEHLEHLAIRYAPNIEGLPTLKSWEKLTSFIGWNIEATQGKLLRKSLKDLAKERTLSHSSVSKLRTSIWFTTEYGIPFSNWEGKKATLAVKTYKATLKKLKKAKEEQAIKELLVAFTKTFNTFPAIETTEREDIGEAINQLRQVPALEIDATKAYQWFDAYRDY